ncbi:MAG: hypothetical protein ACO3ZZ_06510 [Solirubrobacterales bacterium]
MMKLAVGGLAIRTAEDDAPVGDHAVLGKAAALQKDPLPRQTEGDLVEGFDGSGHDGLLPRGRGGSTVLGERDPADFVTQVGNLKPSTSFVSILPAKKRGSIVKVLRERPPDSPDR